MRERPIRVLLVDDQILMRRGLRKLLEVEDGIEVIGEAADGVEALQVIAETRPDVALVDARMLFREVLYELYAVHLRHPGVHQSYIGPRLGDELHCLHTVGGLAYDLDAILDLQPPARPPRHRRP